ncbi:hypothetical protein Peur_026706 [Populus x canadensis]
MWHHLYHCFIFKSSLEHGRLNSGIFLAFSNGLPSPICLFSVIITELFIPKKYDIQISYLLFIRHRQPCCRLHYLSLYTIEKLAAQRQFMQQGFFDFTRSLVSFSSPVQLPVHR